jgi:energy-coupling factor transporter ATP-binding protein EcfA2
MNIILFGPPGIGKSTLIGTLKTLGQRAIDLEDLYPNRLRFQIPNVATDTFIGAADLDPKRTYPNAVKVLLYLPQDKYEARRAQRDQANSAKAAQRAHQIDEWLNGTEYGRIVDVSPHPDQVAKTLIGIMKGGTHGNK